MICSTRKCFIAHKKDSLDIIDFPRKSSDDIHRVQRDQWAFSPPSCGLNRKHLYDSYVIQIESWNQQPGLGDCKSQQHLQESIREHKLALQHRYRSGNSTGTRVGGKVSHFPEIRKKWKSWSMGRKVLSCISLCLWLPDALILQKRSESEFLCEVFSPFSFLYIVCNILLFNIKILILNLIIIFIMHMRF